jgi:hypothetical protein
VNLWHRLDAIYADDRLSCSERALAVYLAFRVNENTMTCQVGAGRIARETGFKRRSVQRIVDRLERFRVLTVRRVGRSKGQNEANQYTLRLEGIASQGRHVATLSPVNSDPQSANSDRRSHKPSEPINNRAPDGGSALKGALAAGVKPDTQAASDTAEENAPMPNVKMRQPTPHDLRKLARDFRITQRLDEADDAFLRRVQAVNDRRIATLQLQRQEL